MSSGADTIAPDSVGEPAARLFPPFALREGAISELVASFPGRASGGWSLLTNNRALNLSA